MVFDLGAALRKKEEFESARLADFEFRRRARATRLLAQHFGLDAAALVAQVAALDEAGLLAQVAGLAAADPPAVAAAYRQCLADAHAQLVIERGDPAPHRLA